MKLQRALIRNFKGVREVEIDFRREDGSLRPLTALVGDNGSGKTTVLQAIALVLSLATRRTETAPEFAWLGFLPDRVGSLGPTRIELAVVFDDDEVEHTRRAFAASVSPNEDHEFARRAQAKRDAVLRTTKNVSLVFEEGALTRPEAIVRDVFEGRFWISLLEVMKPEVGAWLRHVGDVFWFDQLRSLGSDIAGWRDTAQRPAARFVNTWTTNVSKLREELIVWWGYHKSELATPVSDRITQVERRLAELFPGTRFVGPAPRDARAGSSVSESYFFLERDGRRYDLAEMSSGEQAIFPLLMAFVRESIARSIVLIDELDLHLHPPEQQALLTSLRKIGPDCQFIITTHSPYLTAALSDDEVVRLVEGRRCQ